jgi:hypothetical protein
MTDHEFWAEMKRRNDETWAAYDAARLKTYLDFYERQTGIRPEPGDEIEMLGTGSLTVPETS